MGLVALIQPWLTLWTFAAKRVKASRTRCRSETCYLNFFFFSFLATLGCGVFASKGLSASSNGIGTKPSMVFPPSRLRADSAVDFYADESSQNAHRYLAIGVLCAKTHVIPDILPPFDKIRQSHGHLREMKWTAVSKHNIHVYEDWVNQLFKLAAGRFIRYNALVVDCAQFDHKTHNEGDSEIGFNKMLYQLLLHRVGRRYGYVSPIYGYLDDRTTKHTPERLREMLNAGLNKWNPKFFPEPAFKRIIFRDSKTTAMIQGCDILTGAIAFDRNGHGSKEGTRKEKIELSRSIIERIGAQPFSRQCNIWDFEFKKGPPGPRPKPTAFRQPPLS